MSQKTVGYCYVFGQQTCEKFDKKGSLLQQTQGGMLHSLSPSTAPSSPFFLPATVASRLSSPRYGDAFGVDILGGNGLLQLVQLPGLLQLLHQALDRLLAPLLLLAVLLALLPAQKSFDDGGSERQN